MMAGPPDDDCHAAFRERYRLDPPETFQVYSEEMLTDHAMTDDRSRGVTSPRGRRLTEATEHLARGRIPQCVVACNQLVGRYPDFADGWSLASRVTLRLGDATGALDCIERALKIAPGSPDWQVQRAVCLYLAGRKDESIVLADQLADSTHGSADYYGRLGALLSRQGRNELALELFDRAIASNPREARHYRNRAAVQLYLGALVEAEASVDQAIELNPDDYNAYWLRCGLRKQTPDRNHLTQLEALAARGIEPSMGQVYVHYTLAKEYEDLEQYERSFACLKHGADTHQRMLEYNVASDERTLAHVRRSYAADLFDGSVVGHDSREPIFIIGLPRTGTTLAERIIGSHSAVFAAGELFTFEKTLATLAQQTSGGDVASSDELVTRSIGVDFAKLGKAYVDSTRPQTGHTPFFVDKLPFNFLYAGPIHLALPRAKVVHLTRNPMDACYSIYKNLFQGAYSYSYDLDELGRYYIAYHDLMAHWHRVMPGVIYDLSYERLVVDTETEIGRLLEFLGLPWEEGCRNFHEHQGASTTASAAQVRQPVYRSSVQKWRHYARQLQGLRDRLEAAGIGAE